MEITITNKQIKEINLKKNKVVGTISSLEDALAYKNDMIIYRFLQNYKLSFQEAEDLFTETKKWIWLCAISSVIDDAPIMKIDQSLIIIDEMWHNFILFTQEYHGYCVQNFGHYVHYVPTTKVEKDKLTQEYTFDPETYTEGREEELKKLYSFVYDYLGQETLIKWYYEYPEKYTPEFMRSIFIRFN